MTNDIFIQKEIEGYTINITNIQNKTLRHAEIGLQEGVVEASWSSNGKWAFITFTDKLVRNEKAMEAWIRKYLIKMIQKIS